MTQAEKVSDAFERTKASIGLMSIDSAIESVIKCKRIVARSRIKSKKKKRYISLLEDMYCNLRKADEISLPA